MELKCWKTFRKEGDVIPAGRGRAPLPPGQHAPQIDQAGNIRQDETHPDTRSECLFFFFFFFFKYFFLVV